MITIVVDDESIMQKLRQLADAAVDLSDALDAIGYSLVESTQQWNLPSSRLEGRDFRPGYRGDDTVGVSSKGLASAYIDRIRQEVRLWRRP